MLSDIHGNNVALDAVLKDAKTEKIDTYIVAGDLITDFPGTNEVIDTIKNLTPYVIKGNRENYMIEYENTKEDKQRWNTIQNRGIAYFYDELRPENLDYIKQLPETLKVTIEGVSIRVVHGSPLSITQGIHLDNQEMLENATKVISEAVLVCGHTHLKAGEVQYKEKTVISAGSIGLHNACKNAQYVILDCEKGKIKQIKIKEIAYDKEKLKEEIYENGILETAWTWTNLNYLDIVQATCKTNEFVKEAMKRINQKYQSQEIQEEKLFTKFRQIDDNTWKELTKEYEKDFLLKRREECV